MGKRAGMELQAASTFTNVSNDCWEMVHPVIEYIVQEASSGSVMRTMLMTKRAAARMIPKTHTTMKGRYTIHMFPVPGIALLDNLAASSAQVLEYFSRALVSSQIIPV
eukprot:768602-Hanusia_phi.AAC.6